MIGVDDFGVEDCFVDFFDLAEMFDFSDFVSIFEWSLLIEFGMLLTDWRVEFEIRRFWLFIFFA